MINTVVYGHSPNFSCHVVGLGGCVRIDEQELKPINNLPCFKYIAVYEDGKKFEIQDVILASDQNLT